MGPPLEAMDSLEELLGPASPGDGDAGGGEEGSGEEGEEGPAGVSPLQAAKEERQRLRVERRNRRASVAEVIPGFASMMQAREGVREARTGQGPPSAPDSGPSGSGRSPPALRTAPSDAEIQSGAAAVVKKLVRSVEKRMGADLRGFMVGNLVPDRALRSSERALELILEKAWKKIEVEELVRREERRSGAACPDDAPDEDELWARELLQSRDWQASLRRELGLPGGSSPAGQPQREALDELVGLKNLPQARPEHAPPGHKRAAFELEPQDEFALARHLGRAAAERHTSGAPVPREASDGEGAGTSGVGFELLFTHHAAAAIKNRNRF